MDGCCTIPSDAYNHINPITTVHREHMYVNGWSGWLVHLPASCCGSVQPHADSLPGD